MNRLLVVWCVLGLFLGSSSCHIDEIELDKIKVADISPSIAIKLGTTTFTVDEFITDLDDDTFEVVKDDDQLITFVYTEEFSFDDNSQIIDVTTVSNTASFSFDTDIPALPISQTVPFDDEFNFEYETPNNEIIDSAFYNSGDLVYEMNSSYPASIDYEWVILDMKDLSTNEDLSRSSFLQYEGVALTETIVEGLVDYKSIVRTEDDRNTFDVLVEGDLILEPDVGLLASQSIDFELTFRDPVFSALFGEFGSEPIVLNDISFDLNFLDEFRSEESDIIYFANPSITFEIENSFGTDLGLDLSQMVGIALDGSETHLETTLDAEDMLVQSPSYSQIGEFVTTTIRIDSDNSSIDELLSALPEQIVFPLEAVPNPEASDLVKNFLTDSSMVHVKATIELPLNLRMTSYSSEFETELDEVDLEELNEGELVATITNGLPFDGVVSLEFLDDSGSSIYTLEDEITFISPEIGDDGRTVESASTESRVGLTTEVMEIIKNASSIRSTITLSSSDVDNETNVKVYSDYAMTLDLGIIGEVNIEL